MKFQTNQPNIVASSGLFRLRVLTVAVAAAFAVIPTTQALSQDYPSRPVQLVVPVAPGGGTDTVARRVAAEMQKALGQSVYVENRPGANARIGTDFVAKSAPDGQTLIFGSHGGWVTAPFFGDPPPYDSLKDFAPITLVYRSENVIAIKSDSPIKTLGELIEASKKEPGKFTYGTAGIGGPTHLQGELLKKMGEFDMVHIPYQGTGPAITAVLSGDVDLVIGGIPAIAALIGTGELRGLGVTGAAKSPALPDVDPIAAAVPGYDNTSWFDLFAPAGTPKPIVDKIRDSVLEAVKSPEIVESLRQDGAKVTTSTPEELQALVQSDYQMYENLITTLGLK